MSDERIPTQWNSGGMLAQLLETLEAAPSTMMTHQPAIVLSPDFAKRAAAALRAIAPPDVGEPLAPPLPGESNARIIASPHTPK